MVTVQQRAELCTPSPRLLGPPPGAGVARCTLESLAAPGTGWSAETAVPALVVLVFCILVIL